MSISEMKMRVGVIGLRRGMSFASSAEVVGMELVAMCDTQREKLAEAGEKLGVSTYTDYDKFLEHEMDAVILANYFHQHAPLAVKALGAGMHVMSETSACKTLGEGVALARAVERSGKIYMFAENYPYFAYNQEMRRLYESGEIGEVQYSEGEYNHSANSKIWNELAPGLNHWRNHLPPTYYCTHAMGPIMSITNTRPVSVNAQSIAASEKDLEQAHVRACDQGSVSICRMSNGSMSRIMGLSLRGNSIWYRFHGTRGLMENTRAGSTEMVRILHEDWDRGPGDVSEKIYKPDLPVHADLAEKFGHGGGDFFTGHYFAEAIRKNEQPYQDVYWGLDATVVGIQGWRSCLANGASFDIPDFRDESVRKKYEGDDWSPFPEDRAPGQPWPSIKGEIRPSPEGIAAARKVWLEMGYNVD
ncbi:MAG TPA: Gfo/Idh/MocA family oxidoreductase [Armatimonadota bacterium]|jgi:predicted dehydrogenase